MAPKISIITVCYNEHEVGRTCESVVNQTYKNYEWIVIDGGSTGKCIETLKAYADKMTVFVSEKDSGIFNAMNKGIRQAKGEYLLFMNAGDAFFHQEVLGLAATFLNGTDDIIFGSENNIKGKTNEISQTPPQTKINPELFIIYGLPHQSTFIKRELFDKFGLYNEGFRIVSDWEKWIVFAQNNCSFKYIPLIIADFYFEGISSIMSPLHKKERCEVLSKYFDEETLFNHLYFRRDTKNIKLFGISLLKFRKRNHKNEALFLGVPVLSAQDHFVGGEKILFNQIWKLFGLLPIWKRSYQIFA